MCLEKRRTLENCIYSNWSIICNICIIGPHCYKYYTEIGKWASIKHRTHCVLFSIICLCNFRLYENISLFIWITWLYKQVFMIHSDIPHTSKISVMCILLPVSNVYPSDSAIAFNLFGDNHARHWMLYHQMLLIVSMGPWTHYIDVIMTIMTSLITSLTDVYSNVNSDADQRKNQSPASLAFVGGIYRDRWIPRIKGQLRGKCFHLMTSWISLGWLRLLRFILGDNLVIALYRTHCYHILYQWIHSISGTLRFICQSEFNN